MFNDNTQQLSHSILSNLSPLHMFSNFSKELSTYFKCSLIILSSSSNSHSVILIIVFCPLMLGKTLSIVSCGLKPAGQPAQSAGQPAQLADAFPAVLLSQQQANKTCQGNYSRYVTKKHYFRASTNFREVTQCRYSLKFQGNKNMPGLPYTAMLVTTATNISNTTLYC